MTEPSPSPNPMLDTLQCRAKAAMSSCNLLGETLRELQGDIVHSDGLKTQRTEAVLAYRRYNYLASRLAGILEGEAPDDGTDSSVANDSSFFGLEDMRAFAATRGYPVPLARQAFKTIVDNGQVQTVDSLSAYHPATLYFDPSKVPYIHLVAQKGDTSSEVQVDTRIFRAFLQHWELDFSQFPILNQKVKEFVEDCCKHVSTHPVSRLQSHHHGSTGPSTGETGQYAPSPSPRNPLLEMVEIRGRQVQLVSNLALERFAIILGHDNSQAFQSLLLLFRGIVATRISEEISYRGAPKWLAPELALLGKQQSLLGTMVANFGISLSEFRNIIEVFEKDPHRHASIYTPLARHIVLNYLRGVKQVETSLSA